tara:strand:- start:11428 stop:14199 length:2772 start_codon:yes stop_codon:yes gene_type:complete
MRLIKTTPLLSNRNVLLQHFNDTLALLTPIAGTEFASASWQFKYQTSANSKNITLDFSLFSLPHLKFVETIDLIFDEQVYQVSSAEFAKILFLSQASANSAGNYMPEFKMLTRLFSFMSEQGITCLNADDYQALFQYLMTMEVSASGVKQRFSSLGYLTAFPVNINTLKSTLQLYGIEGVLAHTSETLIKKSQKAAVETVTGLTLADYMAGASFNFLTLSVGRHYIDYCGKYFEQHYPLAKAFQTCLRELPEIIQQAFESQTGSRYNIKKVLQRHICAVLSGRNILTEPILTPNRFGNLQPVVGKERCELIQRLTQVFFWQQYQQACNQTVLLSEKALILLTKQLQLPERFDSFEFLRSMLLTQLTDISMPRDPEALLRQYCATLKDKREITLTQFFDTCALVKNQLLILAPQEKQNLAQLLAKADIPFASDAYAIKEFVGNVEAAGGTMMLALTGWRASEYGFPLAAIKVTDNQDILDSTYTPFRFMLNWVVPKTNGDTKLDREITLSSYLLATQLNSLFSDSDTAPCLYASDRKNIKKANDSSGIFSSRVLRMWQDFVYNYTPFVELRQLDDLKQKDVFSEDDRKEFTRLMQKYPDNAYTADFRHIMQKVTNELTQILATGQLSRGVNDKPGHKLFGFIKGTLAADELAVWQQHLDPLLQQKLKELTIEKREDLDRDLVKACTASVLKNCVYPTPHGFRHIWAEAVLRRYSGDVGWFIRSHFKHLDERFFMRYLRLKNFKDIHDIAKRTAVSSIVRMHLLTLRDDQRAYSGKFDVLMRRLGKATKVISLDELHEVAEQFAATEVIDLKANSWCNCILRRTTEKQAKCAVDGIPQRQNADPSLCLGCINGDIEEGHVVGIMIQVENDVKILKNLELPQSFKNKSKSTVINARKQFLTLKRNSGSNKYDDHIKYFDDALVSGG